MNPHTKFMLVPMIAALGFAAPLAHGQDGVNVRASILFDINGGTFGYREPYCERVVVVERPVVVEQPVVYVRRVEPRPVVVVHQARPVVVVRDDCHHGYGRAVVVKKGSKGHDNGRKVGHAKQEYRNDDRYVMYRDRNNDSGRRGNVREAVQIDRDTHNKIRRR